MAEGIIVKSIGGLYFTESSDNVYECKARGVFRNKGIAPCVGDRDVLRMESLQKYFREKITL